MSRIRAVDGRRGAAAVEFALLLPVLLMLFVGTAEIMTYLRAANRLERTAAEIANAATQLDRVTAADIAGLFDAANAIASPFAAWTSSPPPAGVPGARTFISVVTSNAARPIGWSCARGDAARQPRLVVPGAQASDPGSVQLPAGFAVPSGQTLLVVEVVSAQPGFVLLGALFGTSGPAELRSHAILRPRQAQLNVMDGAPGAECR